MALDVIKGADKDMTVTLNEKSNPYDLTGIEFLRACFENDAGHFYKSYIPAVGDVTSASAVISNIAAATLALLSGLEGQPISGPGIPASAKIVSLPDSATSPSASGTLVISVNATATAVAQALIVGDILLLSPLQWGKIKISLHEADTDTISSPSFEVKLIKSSVTSYAQFPDALNIIERFC